MEKQNEGMFSTYPRVSLSYFFQKTTLRRNAKCQIILILLVVFQHLYVFQKFQDKTGYDYSGFPLAEQIDNKLLIAIKADELNELDENNPIFSTHNSQVPSWSDFYSGRATFHQFDDFAGYCQSMRELELDH